MVKMTTEFLSSCADSERCVICTKHPPGIMFFSSLASDDEALHPFDLYLDLQLDVPAQDSAPGGKAKKVQD